MQGGVLEAGLRKKCPRTGIAGPLGIQSSKEQLPRKPTWRPSQGWPGARSPALLRRPWHHFTWIGEQSAPCAICSASPRIVLSWRHLLGATFRCITMVQSMGRTLSRRVLQAQVRRNMPHSFSAHCLVCFVHHCRVAVRGVIVLSSGQQHPPVLWRKCALRALIWRK